MYQGTLESIPLSAKIDPYGDECYTSSMGREIFVTSSFRDFLSTSNAKVKKFNHVDVTYFGPYSS